MKKITDLWEKECICCTTQEECDIIMDMMHDAGLKWSYWDSYIEQRESDYLPCHCFYPFEWEYSYKEYYKSIWYTIYPASEFIEAKRQPKQGELVLVRDYDNKKWEEAIYLCEVPRAFYIKYLCVADIDISNYKEWKNVIRQARKYIKQLPTTSTYTIECTTEQYEKVKDLISKK